MNRYLHHFGNQLDPTPIDIVVAVIGVFMFLHTGWSPLAIASAIVLIFVGWSLIFAGYDTWAEAREERAMGRRD